MTYKGKILAVDDTPASLTLLAGILRHEGYEVYSATNGEQALGIAASLVPELVLLDIRMPGMDGYEVCRRLKADPLTRDMPVIFVSATSDSDEKVQGFRLGAVDFITKPYQRDELMARVHTHLELSRLHNHLEEVVELRTAELKESEQHFRQLFEEASVAIALADAHSGKIIDLNHAMEQLTGWSKTELIGKPQKMLHPEEPGEVSASFEQHRSHSDSERIETRLLTRDGKLRDVAIKASMLNLAGKAALIGFFEDITERRAAKLALRAQQQFVRQVIDANPNLIHVDDADGVFLLANQAMADAFGRPLHEIVGSKISDINPNALEAEQQLKEDRQVILTRNEIRTTERSSIGGQQKWFLSIKRPIVLPDGTLNALSIAVDITEQREYQERLFNSKELLERIFANLHTLIAYMDADFNFIRVNQAYATAHGRAPDEFIGKNHFALFPDRDIEKVFREVRACGRPYTALAQPCPYRQQGEAGYWDYSLQPVNDEQGQTIGLVLSMLDRTTEKRSEEKLRLYGRALDASVNAIMIVDAALPEQPIIYVNPAFTSITGYSAADALGRNPRFLQSVDQDQPEIGNIRSALREKRDGKAVLRNYRKDGSLFWNELYISPVWGEHAEVTHFIGVMRDISSSKNYEAELERMANFDTLTGLPNRNLFQDRLLQAIAHAHRSAGLMAVAVLDLDGFKLINDSLGHHAGDLLLQEIAHRLSACVREVDTVARLAGDEFVIAMPELTKAEDIGAIAEKLLREISVAMRYEQQDIYLSASIGISIYSQDGSDAESLLKHADLAMHRAKEQGRNSYQFYAPEMNLRVTECLSLGNELHHALLHKEFELHYQPQVDLHSGRIVGVEALLRWRRADSSLMLPGKFIPIAEECGMIVPIGTWVLQQACLTARAWHDLGYKIVVAVNLSARQIREPGFVGIVQDALKNAGLDARYLELELTEGILIEQAEFVFDVFRQLRSLGVELSLDDFGTGYSSLSYLKRFPIGRLKIDQSFIRDIVNDPEDAAIVSAIISMGHNLKLKVIAEGVESVEQLTFLRTRHCDEIQGYYFSKPQPEQEITAMLKQGMTIAPADEALAAPALLLVDDEENILNALVRLLRRDGYRILRTTSAQEALGILAGNEVGVIVSDQRMPEMDGVEFLRRAKQLHPDSVRIVLSGYTDLKSVTDAINEGAVYKFLTKPWEDEPFRNQIREAFQRYEMKKEHNSLVTQLAAANDELSRAKLQLEQRVDQTTLESMRNMDILMVSQEVLECLPAGVIGIDMDGTIVVANQKAGEILNVSAGSLAADCLPEALNELVRQSLRDGKSDCLNWQDRQGVDFTCCARHVSASSHVVLMIAKTPTEAPARAAVHPAS